MRLTLPIAAVVALGLLAVGCAGSGGSADVHGKAIPGDAAAVELKRIIDDPVALDGKLVVINGRITNECPSGCWFRLQDESGEMYMTTRASNYSIPQHVHKKEQVYGRVFLERGRPRVLVLGAKLI